ERDQARGVAEARAEEIARLRDALADARQGHERAVTAAAVAEQAAATARAETERLRAELAGTREALATAERERERAATAAAVAEQAAATARAEAERLRGELDRLRAALAEARPRHGDGQPPAGAEQRDTPAADPGP
ncbi:MAG: hypothetical protein DIU60_023575, partial [Actinomycetes bacterium]